MSCFKLTTQQRAAIDCDNSIVITACPGSGKTTVVREKIRKITSALPSHRGIIAITFTKKASEELKKRCKENAHDTKRSFFGTIDSFCLNELILPFLARVWRGKPSDCQIVKNLDSSQKLYLLKQYSSPTLREIVSDPGFKKLYDDGALWMSSFSALSLLILQSSLSAQRYLKARYSQVFIDEYQDSSESQHELFIKLYDLGLVATAVGDVDQSIYRFRGSESKFLLDLKEDHTEFSHFKLDTNHRCHPSIVNYASRVIDPKFPLIPNEGKIYIYRRLVNGNLKNVAETSTRWITGLLTRGQIEHASDVAILAKKSSSLLELATNFGLSYRLHAYTPLTKIGTESSDVYSDLLYYKFKTIRTAQSFIDKYSSQLSKYNIVKLRGILKDIRSERKLEIFIEKCNHFINLMGMHDLEAENNAVKSIWSSDVLLKLFKPVVKDEVQLMTLHNSKGLEFKVVIHIDLEEWSFPHRIKGENWEDVNYPSLEDDRNLHYVGITRAEKLCILVQASQRRNSYGECKKSKPSYFLNLPQLEGLYR